MQTAKLVLEPPKINVHNARLASFTWTQPQPATPNVPQVTSKMAMYAKIAIWGARIAKTLPQIA